MLHTKIVDSKKQKILTSNAEKFIKDSKFGASIYFLGTVRNINDNKTVTGITYDSHDEMVIKSFEEIYNDAEQKLDIKDKAVIPRGTDLDVLACIDGKVHFYEVKRSFSGIDTRQIEDLIKVSSIIRPDVAGFAIHSNANKEYLKNEDIQNIRQELQNIDVKFESSLSFIALVNAIIEICSDKEGFSFMKMINSSISLELRFSSPS